MKALAEEWKKRDKEREVLMQKKVGLFDILFLSLKLHMWFDILLFIKETLTFNQEKQKKMFHLLDICILVPKRSMKSSLTTSPIAITNSTTMKQNSSKSVLYLHLIM